MVWAVLIYVAWVLLIWLVNKTPKDRPRIFIRGVQYYSSSVEYRRVEGMFKSTDECWVVAIYAG